MKTIDAPKKVRHKFPVGHKFAPGRPKGTLNKDRLVRESISEEEFKLLMKALIDQALGKKSDQKIDLVAAKMVIDLLPVHKSFILHSSLKKIQTAEQVDKAMEDTLTLVGNEELSLEDAVIATNIIGKRYETILTEQNKILNEILEREKINS
jgi:hypothetical protein